MTIYSFNEDFQGTIPRLAPWQTLLLNALRSSETLAEIRFGERFMWTHCIVGIYKRYIKTMQIHVYKQFFNCIYTSDMYISSEVLFNI